MRAAELAFEQIAPGFSKGFMTSAAVDELYTETYVDVHRRYVESRPRMAELLS
jgi:hypothetical protein